METIYALATAPGKAGVAVIRISGPEADQVATLLAGDLPGIGMARVSIPAVPLKTTGWIWRRLRGLQI